MPQIRRLRPSAVSALPALNLPFSAESAKVSFGSLDFAYTLFAPMHYVSGYAYPLIVWLHGSGNDERQLQRIMPLISMQNYVAVALQGMRDDTTPNAQTPAQGYEWLQTDLHIQKAEQRVFDSIELARQKYHIASHRIFLAGFDCGGTMALRLAMSHPSRFAGVLSLCGAFPSGGTLFGNLIAARRLGVFLATGRNSNVYPADQVCGDLRLLHTAGISVTLREYPYGHELQPQMLGDVNRWIMEQINPKPTPSDKADAAWSQEEEIE